MNSWRNIKQGTFITAPTTWKGHSLILRICNGGCERIKSTPIPFSYNILLHRIVAIYCIALPFGLVPLLHSVTQLWLHLSDTLLGIDALGDEIEELFGHDDNDLPLLKLTTMIEHNVRQRIGDENLPALKHPNPITRVLN